MEPNMNARRIRLHIDALVLEGYSEQDAPAIRDALREELFRHLYEREGLEHVMRNAAIDRLDAGTMPVAANTTRPQALGAGIAESVYGALKTIK
jgi:hypothetical protein